MYRKTVDELQNDQREKLVIDIRSEEDYTKETYPGAKHIFWETFMDHIGEIPKDQPVYLFCIPDREVMKSRKSYRTKDMRYTA